jgi:HlyD family secretion protein
MTLEMDRKVPQSKRRNRRLMAGAAALVLLAGLGYGAVKALGGAERSVRVPAATVTIDPVQAGVFHDLTPLLGKVVPHDTIYLDALEGGQVERVLAHAGDTVTAGQPLIAFRNTELELDVLDREGRLIESITQLQTFEKQLEDTRIADEKSAAEIDYNINRLTRASLRRRDLAAKGDIAAEANDQIHDELDYNARLRPLQMQSNDRQEALRVAQLPQIHAQLASLQQDLTITRAKLGNLVVKAPVAGQLTDLVQNIGENHNRGERLGQIVPQTGFKVTAPVDEYYLGRVKVGQTAAADIDGRPWKLRVERVYPQVKDSVFTVDLAFDGPAPADLLPGQAVDGKLSLGGDQPALVVPVGPFLDRSGGDWAMVVDADGRHAERRRIKIGRRNAGQVEVLSGLKPGERIITSDYAAFEKVDRVDLSK